MDREAGALLDEMSGERKSKRGPSGVIRSNARNPEDVFFGQIDRRDRESQGYTGAAGEGGASRFFLSVPVDEPDTLRFFYCAKAGRRERSLGLDSPSTHPTVKPIALMRWLVRLITPPGGTVLDCFLGSGSTGCAAALEGFDFIGIEMDAEYITIAEARIAHWQGEAERAANRANDLGPLFAHAAD